MLMYGAEVLDSIAALEVLIASDELAPYVSLMYGAEELTVSDELPPYDLLM